MTLLLSLADGGEATGVQPEKMMRAPMLVGFTDESDVSPLCYAGGAQVQDRHTLYTMPSSLHAAPQKMQTEASC